MKDVFELKEPPYNLRSESNHFTRRNIKTTYYDLLSIKHQLHKYGNLFHKVLEDVDFKGIQNSWCPDHCPCRLCKTCIAQLGFILRAYIHLFMAESGYILVTIVYLQYDVIMMP